MACDPEEIRKIGAGMEYGPDILRDEAQSSRLEWLITNGIGGYASGTLSGVHTRRYHGLLVAALSPPTGRTLLLSNLEETVRVNGQTFDLSANQYPGVLFPQGFQYLIRFRPFPAPTFLYEPTPSVQIEKTIWMAHGRNTTFIRYRLCAAPAQAHIELILTPLIAFRDYHQEFHHDPGFPTSVSWEPPQLSIVPDAIPLYLSMPHAQFTKRPDWYYNQEHLREMERGFDFRSDLYAPGQFRADLSAHAGVTLTASLSPDLDRDDRAWTAWVQRQQSLIARAGYSDDFGRALVLAADQFIVTRQNAHATIIAGYPWFTDWGRDTMISLPGLCLSTGRHEIAKEILTAYAQWTRGGMLLNRFPDAGHAPEYGSADAALWYVQATYAYLNATEDADFMARQMPILTAILDQHADGVAGDIRMDKDGLLTVTKAGLSWMDARVEGEAVTPRCGKLLEINALWYSALCILSALRKQRGQDSERYAKMAQRVRGVFVAKFVRPDGEGLLDLIESPHPQDRPDAIRPNQIFAVSLPFSPLDAVCAKGVVDVVQAHLLTPYGLRSLSPKDPAYQGFYGGCAESRDGAYHQGTVWPWLLGPFVEAHLRVYQDVAAARAFLVPMQGHLCRAGVGTISEIFAGDPPHAPDGCIAQAWSVAEVLRLWKRLTVPTTK
jgi:predicted glycogen debranching enzyme